MPSIAQAPASHPLNSRKRRRDDTSHSNASIAMEKQIEMKLAASPLIARHETTTFLTADKMHSLANEKNDYLPRYRSQKRLRSRGSWGDEMEYSEKEAQSTAAMPAKIDLSPCHICHRKPSERKELDAFADCDGCGRRTCYICIRQCEGLGAERYPDFASPDMLRVDDFAAMMLSLRGDEMCLERNIVSRGDSGYDSHIGEKLLVMGWEKEAISEHRGKVCSRCCVERGVDGKVWCLGCLRTEKWLVNECRQ